MIEFIPPTNIDAERAVLGCMLISEEAKMDGLELLREEDFSRGAHRDIFTVIREMTARRVEIDSVTMMEELRARGILDQIGGISYVSGLTVTVPTAANLRYYADIVREKSILRQIGTLCDDINQKAASEEFKGADLLGELQSRADTISVARRGQEPVSLLDLSMRTLDDVDKMSKTPGQFTGLQTGLYDFDTMTGGLQRGDLVIIAGRPSMGKSALVQRIVQGVAEREPDAGAILWASLEMSQEQIGQRWLCTVGQVDSSHIRIGRISEEEMKRLDGAMKRLSLLTQVYIDDSPGQTVAEIRAKARRLKNKHGLALVAVDYLQLMGGGPRKAERRDLEVGEMSRGLKALAREMDCVVVALSQLNRAVEARQKKEPTLADLRESGSLEQDADVVAFVYREEHYFPGKRKGEADLIIAKQRTGPCDTVRLSFTKQFTAFESLAWRG